MHTVVAGSVIGGTATTTSATVSAQKELPDFDGYLSGIDGGVKDLRGSREVIVEVGASGNRGNLAFSPAGIWIDEGTKVIWKWTGKGGEHNVKSVNGPASFESERVDEKGHTFEYTFNESEAGITTYQCTPHSTLGMVGAVAVGNNIETKSQSTNKNNNEESEEKFDLLNYTSIGSILAVSSVIMAFIVNKTVKKK